MSIDEWIVFVAAIAFATFGWTNWYLTLFKVWSPGHHAQRSRFWLQWLPIICISILFTVLLTLASFDVIGDTLYTVFYVTIGLAWLVAARDLLFLLFDFSWRDDAVERNNKAAVTLIFGALLGVTAIYAGSNIGDGLGWWVVIFTGGLATIGWFVLLGLLELTCKAFERVTVDRDISVATRLAAYMMASGLVLGRASAGDWISAQVTLEEFIYAWPVLPLAAIAVVVEWVHGKRTWSTNTGKQGAIIWAAGYLIMAVGLIMLFPPMTQNPWYGP